jgi:hypothetical protein
MKKTVDKIPFYRLGWNKWHYRVKSWVIFKKGQFTHICQLNVSCGQDSVSGIVLC